jgi:hypothetical protein
MLNITSLGGYPSHERGLADPGVGLQNKVASIIVGHEVVNAFDQPLSTRKSVKPNITVELARIDV